MSDVEAMILDQIMNLLDNEPPKDAGDQPSMEVHDRAGAAWAEWDKQLQALRLVLSQMLVNKAIQERMKRDGR